MRTKLFSLFFALVASVGTMYADDLVKIGDLYYTCSSGYVATVVHPSFDDSQIYHELTTVNIPTSIIYRGTTYNVTRIGGGAFNGCSKLTSITIPNSITSIGGYAFKGCASLTSVKIPRGITAIEDYTFYEFTGLTSIEIPNSVTTIGREAFRNCTGLISVTIPNSATSIGQWAFLNCSSLTAVIWKAKNCNSGYFGSQVESFIFGNEVEVIPEDLCSGMERLTSIDLPNSITSIGNYAFASSGLTSVTIPNSVITIGGEAFARCKSLASVTIGNGVTSIGGAAFCNCSSLSTIIVADGNAKYDSRNNCNAIIETSSNSLIVGGINTRIPSDITSIYGGAFHGSGLTSIEIPNNVTSIGQAAFLDCSSLTSVIWKAKNCNGCSFGAQVESFVFGNEVEYIPASICSGMNKLTSIEIPNSVASIGENAFSWCNNIISVIWNAKNCNGYNFGAQVESFVFGNEVEYIPASICSGMNKLTSIEIPNSVTSIGRLAFKGCENLDTVICLAETPPTVGGWMESAFHHYSKLYVPKESINAYKNADEWKKFYPNIFPITADETTGTAVTATPSNNSVILSWPFVSGADTYIINISINGKPFCTLTFNAQGQLLTLNFAMPACDGHPREMQTALQTAKGWQYTVNGLDPATNYIYTVTAKQGSSVLFTQSVEFHTNWLEPIDNVQSDKAQSTKVLRNGQLFIERNGRTYDAKGQEVM